MVRSVAVGFGAVTMLALAGSAVLGGQGRLAMKHRAAAPSLVEAIQDSPTSVPASVVSVQPVVSAPAAPAVSASHVVSTPASSRARVQAHPAVPPAARPQAASGPLGQSMGITQLLSLAQSPALANILPTGGTTSGNGFLSGLLQQSTDPVATPAPAVVQPAQVATATPAAPAQPPLVDAAVTHANNGDVKDAGDAQK